MKPTDSAQLTHESAIGLDHEPSLSMCITIFFLFNIFHCLSCIRTTAFQKWVLIPSSGDLVVPTYKTTVSVFTTVRTSDGDRGLVFF
jgi:hypothetical protein